MLARAGKEKRRPWTAEEDAILRDAYTAGGPSAAVEAMPYRSRSSINYRVGRIGVRIAPHWTEREDKILTDLWLDGRRLCDIAKELGRPEIGCYAHAVKIGLPIGVPDGFESLTAAARRTGCDSTRMMRHVLLWAGVKIHVWRSPKKKAKHRQHFVCPEDVDDAMAKWARTEPVATAAHRIGVAPGTLRTWLIAAGVTPPESRREVGRPSKGNAQKRRVWRVTDEEVKRAQAMVQVPKRVGVKLVSSPRRGLGLGQQKKTYDMELVRKAIEKAGSVAGAARMIGATRATLSRRMKEAGIAAEVSK